MNREHPSRVRNTRPSAKSVRGLVRAICRLSASPEWLVAALTETLNAMPTPTRLTTAEVEYLLSSSAFTPDQVTQTSDRVARGSLALDGAESFLSALYGTWTLTQVANFLGVSNPDVLGAVAQGQLYAVSVADSLRFPVFQFDVGQPERVIPNLPELIATVGGRWSWLSTVAFMETRQQSLVAVAKQTPRAWLLDGGSFDDVKHIIESASRR